MKITGIKRWVVLVFVSILSGTMVYTPYLRFNYYDQMVIVFTEYKPLVDASVANSFMGDLSLVVGVISMVMYVLGGPLADKFCERNMVALGGVTLGVGSLLFAALISSEMVLLAHAIMALGVGFMFSAYLKLIRKLGDAHEQGRMYSSSEFVRGLIGTCLGFLGVGLLDQAVLPSGVTDPTIVGQQFALLLILNAVVYFVLSAVIMFLVPKKVIGAEFATEEEAAAAEVPFTLKSMIDVIKMPGVWLIAILVFFCYSFVSAGNGYIGTYTVQVLGVDETLASSFAIVRNYIIAAASTLLIGFVALKFKSEARTLGVYLGISAILVVIMLLTQGTAMICVVVSFVFAFFYTGMKGLYFATLHEVAIPVHLTGVATGIISVICYTPDIFFGKLAGFWLDTYGTVGFDYIWFWAIGCGVLGVISSIITVRYSKKVLAKTDAKLAE